jgi:hypothetical protein
MLPAASFSLTTAARRLAFRLARLERTSIWNIPQCQGWFSTEDLDYAGISFDLSAYDLVNNPSQRSRCR